jgi:hypothetical protein
MKLSDIQEKIKLLDYEDNYTKTKNKNFDSISCDCFKNNHKKIDRNLYENKNEDIALLEPLFKMDEKNEKKYIELSGLLDTCFEIQKTLEDCKSCLDFYCNYNNENSQSCLKLKKIIKIGMKIKMKKADEFSKEEIDFYNDVAKKCMLFERHFIFIYINFMTEFVLDFMESVNKKSIVVSQK